VWSSCNRRRRWVVLANVIRTIRTKKTFPCWRIGGRRSKGRSANGETRVECLANRDEPLVKFLCWTFLSIRDRNCFLFRTFFGLVPFLKSNLFVTVTRRTIIIVGARACFVRFRNTQKICSTKNNDTNKWLGPLVRISNPSSCRVRENNNFTVNNFAEQNRATRWPTNDDSYGSDGKDIESKYPIKKKLFNGHDRTIKVTVNKPFSAPNRLFSPAKHCGSRKLRKRRRVTKPFRDRRSVRHAVTTESFWMMGHSKPLCFARDGSERVG